MHRLSLLRPTGLLLLAALCLTGCELLGSDEDDVASLSGVYVANQGNFTAGDGSLTVYDPATEQAAEVLGADGQLGTIVQSVALIGGRGYVLGNSGNRIDVLDLATNARIAQITDVVSPRYMAEVAPGKAYVTNLFEANFTGGSVTVIDLDAQAKGATISVGDNPEGIAVAGDRVFVANHGFGAGSTVSVLDPATDAVVQTLDVDCDGPRFLAADADDEVWVFCTGQTLYDERFNVIGETDGAVRVLDAETGAIVQRFAIDGRLGTAGPGQDAFYSDEAEAVFVVKDEQTVIRYDAAANVEADRFTATGDPIGAIAYDAAAEQLYLGRVAGFSGASPVTVHAADGTPLGTFTAGVAPTFIAFRR